MQAMDISRFFSSAVGMYISQAFFHSLVVAALVDSAVYAWNITNPLLRQRLRLIALFFPVFSFPAYQLINPERVDALFNSNRWFALELWGAIPVGALFVLMLGVTALVFILQEMVPVLRDTLRVGNPGSEWEEVPHNPTVHKALDELSFEKPEVVIVEDEDLVLFSSTGRKPAVFMSTGLVKSLETEQLQAAVAHEAAHIKRSRRPLLVVAFLFRVLMFFNPVVLLEFRRIVQEEEKVCDDIAVSLTRKPDALAGTLRKFLHPAGRQEIPMDGKLSSLGTTLEQYSHDMLLEGRILRLEQGTWESGGSGWFQFAVTLGAVSVLCYFIV